MAQMRKYSKETRPPSIGRHWYLDELDPSLWAGSRADNASLGTGAFLNHLKNPYGILWMVQAQAPITALSHKNMRFTLHTWKREEQEVFGKHLRLFYVSAPMRLGYRDTDTGAPVTHLFSLLRNPLPGGVTSTLHSTNPNVVQRMATAVPGSLWEKGQPRAFI